MFANLTPIVKSINWNEPVSNYNLATKTFTFYTLGECDIDAIYKPCYDCYIKPFKKSLVVSYKHPL